MITAKTAAAIGLLDNRRHRQARDELTAALHEAIAAGEREASREH
jgi:hypothetical protein